MALIDAVLEDLDGRVLAEELRRLMPATQIIFMCNSSDGIELEQRSPGAVWLEKPFTFDEFRAKLAAGAAQAE